MNAICSRNGRRHGWKQKHQRLFHLLLLCVIVIGWGCGSGRKVGPDGEELVLPYEIYWGAYYENGPSEGYIIDRRGWVLRWRESTPGQRASWYEGKLSREFCQRLRSSIQAFDFFGMSFGGSGNITTKISIVENGHIKSVRWRGLPQFYPTAMRDLMERLDEAKTIAIK